MNFWQKIAHWGVTDNMPIYKQKSTIFFNVSMRMGVIAMLVIAVLMFFAGMKFIALGLMLGIPIASFSLILNMKGKVEFSIVLTSIFFPLYFIFISIFSKLNGEGHTAFYYISPRIGIILMSISSFAVIGFYNIKKSFIAIVFGISALLFFDYLHEVFGVGISKSSDFYDTLKLLRYVFGLLFLYMTIIIYALQKINTNYETIITEKNNKLKSKNIEINTQKEEILAQRDEIEAQRNEVEAQRDEVIAQKAKIEAQNKEITDSILYAKRIQQAVLPSPYVLEEFLPEHFILYKPKNIVSGDFYWFKQIDEFSVIAVADCTGHGVPGAFMSMLGISFLNELVTKIKLSSPDKILERMRKKIKTTLSQTGKTGEQKDGMDMALYIINQKTLELRFAGAYNPLWIVRNTKSDSEKNELIVLKADRQPIAVHIKERDFTQKQFQLQKNDCLYSFSDGFQDQFGGDKRQKFMSKKFKQLVSEISQKPMQEQKQILDKKFESWRGSIEQVDDVVVLGVRI